MSAVGEKKRTPNSLFLCISQPIKPESNAKQERVFSQCGYYDTKLRSHLLAKKFEMQTLCSLNRALIYTAGVAENNNENKLMTSLRKSVLREIADEDMLDLFEDSFFE
mmetsp:Transcript_25580/g.30953  ORF Transcript_25580/g.30953 Transcript_25580/m.30953 type:complete len:108 (-) Transcript_25580:39-362(-)